MSTDMILFSLFNIAAWTLIIGCTYFDQLGRKDGNLTRTLSGSAFTGNLSPVLLWSSPADLTKHTTKDPNKPARHQRLAGFSLSGVSHDR